MTLTEIYASPQFAECEQRAFVLSAVGIEHVIDERGDLFVVLVPADTMLAARDHLRRYEEESRPRPAAPRLELYANARVASILYALVLMAVAYCSGERIGGVDWYQTGALTHDAVHQHEWWRLVTALTLHADMEHLLGNLVFGIPYSYFAAQLLGAGPAWAGILIAATMGNLIESGLMTTGQSSIGASTAVFTMLALVAAYSWRSTSPHLHGWAHRWAPWVGAVALLALTGTGGEHTDVFAHLVGFICGALMGLLSAALSAQFVRRRTVQFASGVAALASVIGAWTWALLQK